MEESTTDIRESIYLLFLRVIMRAFELKYPEISFVENNVFSDSSIIWEEGVPRMVGWGMGCFVRVSRQYGPSFLCFRQNYG